MPLSYPIRLKTDSGGRQLIFDGLRSKWLVLTPEEWIRQHFVRHLVERLGYPPSRMANEVSLTFNGMSRRCDTVVFGPDLSPMMVIEYKEERVTLTQEVFDQIARYNSVLKAPYLIVTNGRKTYCCAYDHAAEAYSFLDNIPPWQQLP